MGPVRSRRLRCIAAPGAPAAPGSPPKVGATQTPGPMRFSHLILQLPSLSAEAPCDLGSDPLLSAAAPVQRARAGEVSFLEPGRGQEQLLRHTTAAALILPADPALQAIASERSIAWVASEHPKLSFAELLEVLHPEEREEPGIDPTATVHPTAQLGRGVYIGPQAVVGAGCRIGDGCLLHAGVVLYRQVELGAGCELHAGAVLHRRSLLGAGCVVHANAVIGSEGFGFVSTAAGLRKMPQTGHVVLEDGVEVGCGSCIDRPAMGETRIGRGTKLDNLVQIGHGVQTGRHCAVAAQVGLAGGASLGDRVMLAGQVGVANRAHLGDGVVAYSKAGIHNDVAAGEVVSGIPAIPARLHLRCVAAFKALPEMARNLRRLQDRAA